MSPPGFPEDRINNHLPHETNYPAFVLSVAFPVRSQLQIREVYLENKKASVGIQSSNPRMSWILDSDKRATRQVAYEIRVADSEAGLQSDNTLYWHSGKVASNQSVYLPYSGMRCNPEKFISGSYGFGTTTTALPTRSLWDTAGDDFAGQGAYGQYV